MNLHSIQPPEDLTLLYLRARYTHLVFVRVNPDLITYGLRNTITATELRQYDEDARYWDRHQRRPEYIYR